MKKADVFGFVYFELLENVDKIQCINMKMSSFVAILVR